jgi:O-6-methylguanine DNA methyltransferase
LNKPQVKTQFTKLSIPTRAGKFGARYSERGLAGLNFPKVGSARLPRRSLAKPDRADRTPRRGVPTTIIRWHRTTAAALKNSLAGREPKSLPPLDLSGGTPFQQGVWCALQKISHGKTRSYGEIARRIGKPKAVRAVGGACGANPIPIFIPCHRVLAANGKLGGFSGGLNWKRKLLAREGISFR